VRSKTGVEDVDRPAAGAVAAAAVDREEGAALDDGVAKLSPDGQLVPADLDGGVVRRVEMQGA